MGTIYEGPEEQRARVRTIVKKWDQQEKKHEAPGRKAKQVHGAGAM